MRLYNLRPQHRREESAREVIDGRLSYTTLHLN
jgi:hypothetical protein